jgi:hypothetical protein
MSSVVRLGPDRRVLGALGDCDGTVLRDFSLFGLDSLFRLRAIQLQSRQACLDMPSVVFVGSETADRILPGFGRRVASSWPFKSVIFVADGEASAALAAEGLPVVGVLRAMLIGVDGLLDHPDAATSQATGDQGIGL